jgi:preprotein translocase subunit SecG
LPDPQDLNFWRFLNMQIWTNLVLVVQLLAAIAMIGLVLVQHGKGADMGASFGSGASGSLFGATGSANFLSRFTAVCAGVFFVCTLTMAYLSNSVASRAPSSGGSVLDRAVVPAGAPASAGGAIPGGGASVLPAPVAAPAASVVGGIPTK